MATRCAVYARYSSDQQRPESITDQIRHCRQEAARHPDWVVLDDHVYADEAITGASVEGRGGLQRLIQAALQKQRPFDLILVDDTSPMRPRVVAVMAAGRLVHLTEASRLAASHGARRQAAVAAE